MQLRSRLLPGPLSRYTFSIYVRSRHIYTCLFLHLCRDLILYVNLGLSHWMPSYLVTYSLVCLWNSFPRRDWQHWLGGLNKMGGLPRWTGIIQSIEGLNRTKSQGSLNFLFQPVDEILVFSCPWTTALAPPGHCPLSRPFSQSGAPARFPSLQLADSRLWNFLKPP